MRKPEVVRVVELSGKKDVDSISTVIHNYFNAIVWSVEKSEWEAMSEDERQAFVQCVIKYINRGE